VAGSVLGGAADEVRPARVAVGARVGREFEAKKVEVARPIYSRVWQRGSFRSDGLCPTTAPVNEGKGVIEASAGENNKQSRKALFDVKERKFWKIFASQVQALAFTSPPGRQRQRLPGNHTPTLARLVVLSPGLRSPAPALCPAPEVPSYEMRQRERSRVCCRVLAPRFSSLSRRTCHGAFVCAWHCRRRAPLIHINRRVWLPQCQSWHYYWAIGAQHHNFGQVQMARKLCVSEGIETVWTEKYVRMLGNP
jgi:hypothetical protein